jgi:hypothetical protein
MINLLKIFKKIFIQIIFFILLFLLGWLYIVTSINAISCFIFTSLIAICLVILFTLLIINFVISFKNKKSKKLKFVIFGVNFISWQVLFALLIFYVLFWLFCTSFAIKSNTTWVESKIQIWYFNQDNFLCSINADGTKKRCTNINKEYEKIIQKQFSPDGEKLSFISNNGFFILNTKDFTKEELFSPYEIDDYRWSPDSNKIVYSIIIPDEENKTVNSEDVGDIYLIDVVSKENKLLAEKAVAINERIFTTPSLLWYQDGDYVYSNYTKDYTYWNDKKSEKNKNNKCLKINVLTGEKIQISCFEVSSNDFSNFAYINQHINFLNMTILAEKNYNSNMTGTAGSAHYSSKNQEIRSSIVDGSIYLDDKKLIHMSGYLPSEWTAGNAGFGPANWLPGDKYIIIHSSASTLNDFSFLSIADSETGKFGKLVDIEKYPDEYSLFWYRPIDKKAENKNEKITQGGKIEYGETIRIKKGYQFSIDIVSGVPLNYAWRITQDSTDDRYIYINMTRIERIFPEYYNDKYVTKSGVLNSFKFSAEKVGETEIRFFYQKTSFAGTMVEEKSLKTLIYKIIIE